MKKSTKLLLVIGIGVITAFSWILISVNQADAQTATLGLTISPLTFELTANPGDAVTNKLRVYNPTETNISVKIEAEDFTAVGELGEVKVTQAENETYSLARWITVEPVDFILPAKEQRFVDFTITVPANAEPGGKYGSVLATITGVTGDLGLTGATTVQKAGALVLLMVSGKVEESVVVKEFSASSFLEYGPVSFNIRFENTGTVHVRPKGFISITNCLGDKKIADVPFSQQNVIPGAVRKIGASWDIHWGFGRYAATLVGSYGVTNTPIETQIVTFWILPWKIITGITAGFTTIIVLLYLSRKRWQMALNILIRGEGYIERERKV